MKKTIPFLLILIAMLAAACTPQAEPTPIQLPASEPSPLPTPETVTLPQTDSSPGQSSPAWKEIRNLRFGFGLAVPCWWLVRPIPAEGFGGVMTLANYDETYFMANSNKGYWDWPNGALKIDAVVMENADPALPDKEAYMAFVDASMQGLISSKTQQTGAHTATVLKFSNLVNTNDPPVKVFIYRLAPDKLLAINPIPQSIIDTPDFQAILASIALTPLEQIVLPSIPPAATPLIDASCAQ
ncbi:MAG: hypothetical protein IH589_18945 [Anaerolineales bacterium]|nr:hypothetical protein [Anaerolineales bacterium]